MKESSLISPRNKGDISEYKAIVWLMEQGYAVFKSVATTGPVDLVAIKDNKIRKIDVKTASMQKDFDNIQLYGPSLTKKQEELDIELLYVYEDKVGWKIGHLGY